MKPTKKQIENYVKLVTEKGHARRRTFGEKFNECDYLAGAMAFFFTFQIQTEIPASWAFGPMSGKIVFDGKGGA